MPGYLKQWGVWRFFTKRVSVSVEAGRGFGDALAKLAEKMKGALVEEFTRVLQEIRVGVTRREALHATYQISSFCSAQR